MNDKIKLFETVLGISEKGAASLTSSERSLIESETRALLNAASRNKTAMKAPEGFDSFLKELSTAENADESYEMILKYINKEDKKEESSEDKHEEKEDLAIDKVEEGVEDLEEIQETEEGKDKKEFPKDLDKGKKEPKKDSDKEEKKEEKKEDKDPEKGMEDSKKELMAKIKKAEEDEKKDKEDKDKKKEDKKEEDEKEKKESHLIPGMPSTAAKTKVKVTGSRNILAYFDDKPLFHAVPNQKVKADSNALRRLANKVYGWLVYEGVDYAAKKCGATILAGVDSDIEVNFDKEIPPETEGVSEKGDDVIEENKETPENDVRDEAEFDTQETHSKVEAGVDDDVTVVTEEKPNPTPDSVTDKEEDVIKEKKETPENDIRDEADVDFQSVEANYKKLYASRAKVAAKKANEDFVKKFIRSFNIAAKRMGLNYDDNPYKAASFDVLVEAGIEADLAQELSEDISSEGQSTFVAQLLERTSALMKKSDEYLGDLESDLKDLNIKPVNASKEVVRKSTSKTSRNLRKAASEGNFALSNNSGTQVARSSKSNMSGDIQLAVGDTKISKIANTMKLGR